jgi:hypothetical protein
MGRHAFNPRQLYPKKMKKTLLLVVFAMAFTAAAQDHKGHYGIGLALGEPSGFSIKKFNNNNEAFQYTLGYSAVSEEEGINIGADYLLHNYDIITAEKGRIPFYYGGGIHLKSYNDAGNQLYARVPLGVAYEATNVPVDVFFEFAPGVAVFPKPNLVINFAIGARFYFDVRKAVEKIDDAI